MHYKTIRVKQSQFFLLREGSSNFDSSGKINEFYFFISHCPFNCILLNLFPRFWITRQLLPGLKLKALLNKLLHPSLPPGKRVGKIGWGGENTFQGKHLLVLLEGSWQNTVCIPPPPLTNFTCFFALWLSGMEQFVWYKEIVSVSHHKFLVVVRV